MAKKITKDTTKKSTRGSNFTLKEYEVLCNAWLLLSTNPAVGKDQSGSDMWKNIAAEFNTKLPNSNRDVKSIYAKWQSIQRDTLKYCGFVAQAKTVERSGADAEEAVSIIKVNVRACN